MSNGDGMSEENVDEHFDNLVEVIRSVLDDPEMETEDVVRFLSLYDQLRRTVDAVQASPHGRTGACVRIRQVASERAINRSEWKTMESNQPGTFEAFWETPLPPARPEREGREGDTQPMPKAVDGPIMHHLVQQDLEARLQVGIKRYGQPLQPHNGRDALRDAYEEVLDLAVYLRQAIYESENPHGG
jgi:hypothetical protein